MIPKTIHYCWFGGKPKSRLVIRCLNSWRAQCPGYEIVEWNEDNFDVNLLPFTRDAYSAGKFAFVSDYARLWVLFHHGGVYLDTDVELIQPLDSLLNNEAFFSFETKDWVASGLGMGARQGHPIVLDMMKEYKDLAFPADGVYQAVGCPRLNTRVLLRHGLVLNNAYQQLGQVAVYPSEVLNPLDNATGLVHKTPNTIGIHWYGKSWIPWHKRLRAQILRLVRRALGAQALRRS